MGAHIARQCIRHIMKNEIAKPVVTVLGLTFKEDVPDIRNSKVIDILTELDGFGVETQVHDPLANAAEVKHEFGVSLVAEGDLKPADIVILAVSHADYKDKGWDGMLDLLKTSDGAVFDIKVMLDRDSKPDNITLWRP